MKIYFAADHAGFALKEHLIAFTRNVLKYEVEDLGAYALVADDDYPAIISKAAEHVSRDPLGSRAVVMGGSGQGEAMVANRFKHVRAAVYYGGNPAIIGLSREHNDANVLSLGARFVNKYEAQVALARWLNTHFSGESRHARRLAALDQLPA